MSRLHPFRHISRPKRVSFRDTCPMIFTCVNRDAICLQHSLLCVTSKTNSFIFEFSASDVSGKILRPTSALKRNLEVFTNFYRTIQQPSKGAFVSSTNYNQVFRIQWGNSKR